MDIMTGEVIKDRGVLSELPKRYNFGELVREDEAIATDSPSEAADHLAEGEEDNNDGDQDEAEETHAFPSTNSFVASKLARVVPLRPATGSSDADDLPEFLKAEAIRRELDGGDDDSSSELDGGDDPCSPELNGGDDESSSEDEFNFLPPLPTPAKRTMTPARKIAPAKFRPPKVPNPDFELDHRFVGHNQNNFYRRHRARRTSSPEVSTSIPSPPPSSSPGPSSLPPSSPFSYTPLKSNSGPQREERPNSPTLQRQPVASTSRKTLEDIINEVDLEFPPPPPRALPAFVRRRSPAFVVDLPLTGNETAPSPSPTPPSRLWTRRTLKRKRVVSSGSSSSEEGSPSDRSASQVRGTTTPRWSILTDGSQINWKGKGKSKVDEANQDSESDEGHLDNEGSVDRHSDSHPKSHSEARGPPTLERERRRR